MKKVIFYACILNITLLCFCNSCVHYNAPDNFPKQKFFSYLPYKMGDTVSFVSDSQKYVNYLVDIDDQTYWRASDKMDCGKCIDEARREVRLSLLGDTVRVSQIGLVISCSDRAKFVAEVSLRSGNRIECINGKKSCTDFDESCSYMTVFADYGSPWDPDWNPDFNLDLIFQDFVPLLTITNQEGEPVCEIQQDYGLLWYIDCNGVRWKTK